jgi:hypothetical protein
MSAEALEQQLAAIGLVGRVEARGALAVLTLRDPGAVAIADRRAAAVALAGENGFTHLALELDEDDRDDRASLPRA